MAKCRWCGNKFMPNQRYKVYCCTDCTRKGRRQEAIEKRVSFWIQKAKWRRANLPWCWHDFLDERQEEDYG